MWYVIIVLYGFFVLFTKISQKSNQPFKFKLILLALLECYLLNLLYFRLTQIHPYYSVVTDGHTVDRKYSVVVYWLSGNFGTFDF